MKSKSPVGHSVVISGLSGRFPDSNNVDEFWSILLSGQEFGTIDSRRWEPGLYNLPKRSGKIKDLSKFDAEFFGKTEQESNDLIPDIRIVLEVICEALFDAGLTLEELRNSDTALLIASSNSEGIIGQSYCSVDHDKLVKPQNIAIEVSKFFGTKGICTMIDTACASGLTGIFEGFRLVKTGQCTRAIVASPHLCISPITTKGFNNLNMLAPDGRSKAMDKSANGYCRSEAVTAVIVERKDLALRSYASILNSKCNNDGYKVDGITFPSRKGQGVLLKETLAETGIDPYEIDYVEAHMTGTLAGDPTESGSIMDGLRPRGGKPILVGCLKSNLGHTDESAGLCALIKTCKIFQQGVIPANINYECPNPKIEGLVNGTLSQILKNTPFDGKYIVLNAFGFGGSNVVTILRSNRDDNKFNDKIQIPRLVTVSGRNEQTISNIFDFIKLNQNVNNDGHLHLLNSASRTNVFSHRGFMILNQDSEFIKKKFELVPHQRVVQFKFPGLESSWNGISSEFTLLPPFKKSIDKLSQHLNNHDVRKIVEFETIAKTMTNKLYSMIYTQLALVDTLKELKIEPQSVEWESSGEIAAIYSTGIITIKEALEMITNLAKFILKTGSIQPSFKFTDTLSQSQNDLKMKLKTFYQNHKGNKVDHENVYSLSFGYQKTSVSESTILTQSKSQQMEHFLNSLGHLFINGQNPKIEILYPKRHLPLNCTTPLISHLLKWNHEKSWFVPLYPDYFVLENLSYVKITVDLNDPNFIALFDHFIDGRALFPMTGYLWLAWKGITVIKTFREELVLAVQFNNIRLHRATVLNETSKLNFLVHILQTDGSFAIQEGSSIVATGFIKVIDSSVITNFDLPEIEFDSSDAIAMEPEDIYKEFQIRGYEYGPKYRNVVTAKSDGSNGRVKWTEDWISYADSVLQTSLFINKHRELCLPTAIEFLEINPIELRKEVDRLKNEGTDVIIDIKFDKYTNILYSRGLTMKGIQVTPSQRKGKNLNTVKNAFQFVPLVSDDVQLKSWIETEIGLYESDCIEMLNDKRTSDDKKDNNGTYGQVLRQYLTNLPLIEPELKQVMLSDLCNDMLVAYSIEKTISSQFKIICDNFDIRSKIKICELTFNNKQLFEILKKISWNSSNFQHFLITDSDNVKSESKIIKWIPGEENLSEEVNEADIFMLNHWTTNLLVDNTQIRSDFNISNLIGSIYKNLKDTGFFVLTMRTKLLPIEEILAQKLSLGKPKFVSVKFVLDLCKEVGFKFIGRQSYKETIHSLLFRKIETSIDRQSISIIKLDSNDYNWIEILKGDLNEEKLKRVWLIGAGRSGIEGFVRCLKHEPNGDKIRCLYGSNDNFRDTIDDEIIQKDLTFNFCQGNLIGSYAMEDIQFEKQLKPSQHVYLDVTTKGDLSSFKWFDAPHKLVHSIPEEFRENELLINIHYSALNFKDVMVASGRVPLSAYPIETLNKCPIGIEYSGTDPNGNHIMGFCAGGAVATTLTINSGDIFFAKPMDWTLEDAATIPVAYATVYYALVQRGGLTKGERVLIHAGSGGVGQAAISVCLARNCEVFTTVGNEKKKKFLMEKFPQLKDRHFASSRNNSFEEHILRETNGQGVDIVLNSLSEENLKSGIRCLSENGRFIEIGKYDIVQNSKLDIHQIGLSKSFQAICLAHLMVEAFEHQNKNALKLVEELKDLIKKGIDTGEVKPISRHVFEKEDVEQAFRFMAKGLHIGKVLIKMRDESIGNSKSLQMDAISKTYFYPHKSYILIGGLGGIGLEMAIWMAQRGARNLILTSRSGVKTPYQRYVISNLKNNDINVITTTESAVTYESALEITQMALKQGPIGGIFNLALVLRDSLFENMTTELFQEVCDVKIRVTENFDRITRQMCPQMDHFVCFSSLASSIGNPGQSNYGFANSQVECICRERKDQNLPALAIVLGPVGDVGFFATTFGNDKNLFGAKPQRLSSLLNCFDHFMATDDHTIVLCADIADVFITSSNQKDIINEICYVMGIKDPSSVSDKTTLAELGIDSLMAVEIRQGIERRFNIILTAQEIRNLTFADLRKLQNGNSTSLNDDDGDAVAGKVNVSHLTEFFTLSKDTFVKLNEIDDEEPIFVFPPIETAFYSMKGMLKFIDRPLIGVCQTQESEKLRTVEEMAQFYADKIMENYKKRSFDIIGYSFGGIIAIEVAARLKVKLGSMCINSLFVFDISPEAISLMSKYNLVNAQSNLEEENLQYLMLFLRKLKNLPDEKEIANQLNQIKDPNDRIQTAMKLINLGEVQQVSGSILSERLEQFVIKHQMLQNYNPRLKLDCGDIHLLKSKDPMFVSASQDYGLSKLIDGRIFETTYNGDHGSFISENAQDIAIYIMKHAQVKFFG